FVSQRQNLKTESGAETLAANHIAAKQNTSFRKFASLDILVIKTRLDESESKAFQTQPLGHSVY
ncbi:MAG TPA: hypothetical protein VK203_23950, partial [Nostocaceae cyanobacterium]|nr:hypothetical protein [Nostocaceae cyanobacterium]